MREGSVRKGDCGVSTMSSMIAMMLVAALMLAVLALALLESPRGSRIGSVRAANRSRIVANAVLQQMIPAGNQGAGSTILRDCAGMPHEIKLLPGGASLRNGDIDFSQPLAQAPKGYSMKWQDCADGSPVAPAFDIRWNIGAGPAPDRSTILLSARVTGMPASLSVKPATVEARIQTPKRPK